MATGKRPDFRIIAGAIFLCAGAATVAASPGVGAGVIVVGIALISAGVVGSRKRAQLADRTATPPPAEGGSGPAEPGAATDRGRM
jgi:hypothetical protein